jgi:hypothetical protein
MNPDKIIGQALQSMSGWVSLGSSRRLGKRARWVCREGLDNHHEFVPVASFPGLGAALAFAEVDENDLLG